MDLPPALQHLIDSALDPVHRDPQHAIGSEFISRLGQAGGSLVDSAQLRDLAHRRRATLTLRTAHQVLPLWQQEFPDRLLAAQLLRRTAPALGGGGDWESLRSDLARFWEQLDQLEEGSRIRQGEMFVGNPNLSPTLRAAQFAGGAIADGLEAIINIDGNWEAPGSANGWANACIVMASTAYAGGAPGQEGSDPQKRRVFWAWWLLAAIPAAWHAPLRPGDSEASLK